MLSHIKNTLKILGWLYIVWVQIGTDGRIPVKAQTILSMRQAVEEALANNRSLRAARYEIEASKADEITAGLRPNPTLTGIADIGPSQGQGPADKYYGASFGIPFELGGKRDRRIEYARQNTRVTSELYNDSLRQFTLSVRNAYIDFASSSAQLAKAKENLVLLDSAVKLSAYRVEGKDISLVDHERTEVERYKYQLTTASLENTYRTARISLLNLLGRNADAGNVIIPDPTVFDPIKEKKIDDMLPVDSLLAIAVESRADIRALRAAETADSANLELQKAIASIDLNVSLDFSRQTGTTFYGTTLSIPLKIFDKNQGEIEKASVRIEQARYSTQSAILKLRADITSARSDAMTKQRAVTLLQDTVLEKSTTVRNAVEYAYRHGGTSLVDYLDAARTYNELQTAYYDALADYAKSLLTLNSTIGKDLYYEK